MQNNRTAYQYAIFLISKRDYSVHKLTQKLKLKKFDQNDIDETIEKLIAQNYLREQTYTANKMKRLIQKGHSLKLIKYQLEDEKLTFIPIENEHEVNLDSIKNLVEKKLRNITIPNEYDAKKKLMDKILAFLARKGHSLNDSKHILKQYFNENKI